MTDFETRFKIRLKVLEDAINAIGHATDCDSHGDYRCTCLMEFVIKPCDIKTKGDNDEKDNL